MFKSFFNSKRVIKWEIWYFWLSEWWISSFSQEDQDYIISHYNPLWWDWKSLVEWSPLEIWWNIISLLWGLSWWFNNENDYNIGLMFLLKWEELIKSGSYISKIDLHFFYADQINFYYKFRNINEWFYDSFIEACNNQINIADIVAKEMKLEFWDKLPSHTWYEKLISVLLREGKENEANFLKLKAKGECWRWDWN
jgi:hypothetical protein